MSGGSLVIGQEQDGLGSAGGFFDLQQGWSGKLTQVCFFLSNQMSHLTQSWVKLRQLSNSCRATFSDKGVFSKASGKNICSCPDFLFNELETSNFG